MLRQTFIAGRPGSPGVAARLWRPQAAVAVLAIGLATTSSIQPETAAAQAYDSCDVCESGPSYAPYIVDSYVVSGYDGTPWQVTIYSNGAYTVQCLSCYLPW